MQKNKVDNIKYKKTFAAIWQDLDLSPKKRMFVLEYCNNKFDKEKALAKLGYVGNSAATTASAWINDSQVQEAIRRYVELILGEGKLRLKKEIFDVWLKRATYDPLMFYDINGEPKIKTLKDIPEEWRCVVDGIEKKYYGKDATTYTIVLKLADKEKALMWLDKFIGMTKEEANVQVNVSSNEMPDLTINVLDTTSNNKVREQMEKLAIEEKKEKKKNNGKH